MRARPSKSERAKLSVAARRKRLPRRNAKPFHRGSGGAVNDKGELNDRGGTLPRKSTECGTALTARDVLAVLQVACAPATRRRRLSGQKGFKGFSWNLASDRQARDSKENAICRMVGRGQ